MIKKYHDLIYQAILENGELGVNQISSKTGIPLSTLQKYLTTQQKYFQKTQSRRWDLPDRVISNFSEIAIANSADLLESSLEILRVKLRELTLAITNLEVPISALKYTQAVAQPPVAGSALEIHPVLVELNNKIKNMIGAVSDHVNKVPANYKDLIQNLDWYTLATQMGIVWFNSQFTPYLTEMLINGEGSFDDELVEILSKYQMSDLS